MSAPGSGGISDTRAVFRTVLIVIAVVLTLYLIYLLRKPLGWMVIAGFIAIAVSGPINLLSRHMKRGFATAIVYVGLVLTPFAMLAVLVPPIVEQGQNLADKAPQYAQDVQDYVNKNERLQDLNNKYDLTTKLQEQANKLPDKLGSAAGTLADVGASLVSGIFAAVTILFLSIFMVSAAPRWRAAFLRMHPPHRAELLDRMFTRISNAVGNYVAGALLQALIAGVTSYIVLRIMGVPYPLALALLIFALDLVPLVGATIGAFVVGLVTVFQDFPTVTIIWVIWSIAYQQIENNVIQPRIQAKQTAVEPFFVLASVLFGSTLFGVIGALLAIPAAASVQIAIREYLIYSGRLREEVAEDDDDKPEKQLPKPEEDPPPQPA